ncbi:MAG TPA: sulfate transporter family protein [Hyphomicrobiales bacterium]|nr:sulfate transporter family protein [Hyphomicrobiales bacterium]
MGVIQAALLALEDALSPPFRAVLLKTVGLSLLVLVVLGVIVEAVAASLIALPFRILDVAAWVVAGIAIIAAIGFLVPLMVALVAGFFVDEIAATTERTRYPADPEGRPMTFGASLALSIRFALLVLAVNLLALVLLILPGVNVVVWWLVNGYLLGRQYFELAALRFRSPAEVRLLRRHFAGPIFAGGLLISAFLLIPILNLATPLVATAFMVHLHKRLTRGA